MPGCDMFTLHVCVWLSVVVCGGVACGCGCSGVLYGVVVCSVGVVVCGSGGVVEWWCGRVVECSIVLCGVLWVCCVLLCGCGGLLCCCVVCWSVVWVWRSLCGYSGVLCWCDRVLCGCS